MKTKRVIVRWNDEQKPSINQDYSNVKSDTDQRAPINTPHELYQQYVLGAEVYDELEKETIEDFDNDVYDYEERAEYGEDVAFFSEIERSIVRKPRIYSKRSSKERPPTPDIGANVEESKESTPTQQIPLL